MCFRSLLVELCVVVLAPSISAQNCPAVSLNVANGIIRTGGNSLNGKTVFWTPGPVGDWTAQVFTGLYFQGALIAQQNAGGQIGTDPNGTPPASVLISTTLNGRGTGTYEMRANGNFICGQNIISVPLLANGGPIFRPSMNTGGLNGVWFLGSAVSDPANRYYNAVLFHGITNCNAGDPCNTNLQWQAITNPGKVNIQSPSSLNTNVFSVSPSGSLGDVQIRFSVDGFESAPLPFSVNVPHHTVVHQNPFDANEGFGFTSTMFYRNIDIFGFEMSQIAINEQFPGGWHDDWFDATGVPTNWPQGQPDNASHPGVPWADQLGYNCHPLINPDSCTPTTLNNNGTPTNFQKVHHVVNQTFRLGSATTGLGIVVKVNKAQFYRDHGRHE